MKKSIKIIILIGIIITGLITTKNVYAETYNGEYSIDYLLRNYNVVTLGQKDTDMAGKMKDGFGKLDYVIIICEIVLIVSLIRYFI